MPELQESDAVPVYSDSSSDLLLLQTEVYMNWLVKSEQENQQNVPDVGTLPSPPPYVQTRTLKFSDHKRFDFYYYLIYKQWWVCFFVFFKVLYILKLMSRFGRKITKQC